jgi:hypothetical protein
MTKIRAHFHGKVFIPDQPVDLPTNEPVTRTISSILAEKPRMTPDEIEKLIEEMDKLAAETPAAGDVDWSRDSIYSGSIDDPR